MELSDYFGLLQKYLNISSIVARRSFDPRTVGVDYPISKQYGVHVGINRRQIGIWQMNQYGGN